MGFALVFVLARVLASLSGSEPKKFLILENEDPINSINFGGNRWSSAREKRWGGGGGRGSLRTLQQHVKRQTL